LIDGAGLLRQARGRGERGEKQRHGDKKTKNLFADRHEVNLEETFSVWSITVGGGDV
jgi:hypothetical protein